MEKQDIINEIKDVFNDAMKTDKKSDMTPHITSYYETYRLFYKAIDNKCFNICELLLECGYDINRTESTNRIITLLGTLFRRGIDAETLNWLIDHGYDISKASCVSDKNETYLGTAAYYGNIDAVKIFIEKGQLIPENYKDVLCWLERGIEIYDEEADINKNLECVSIILNNIENLEQLSELNEAVVLLNKLILVNSLDNIKLLLEAGVHANIGESYNTAAISGYPLNFALASNKVEVIKMLYKYGATEFDTQIIDNSILLKPMDYALYVNNEELIELLKTYGEKESTSEEIVQYILDDKCRYNADMKNSLVKKYIIKK